MFKSFRLVIQSSIIRFVKRSPELRLEIPKFIDKWEQFFDCRFVSHRIKFVNEQMVQILDFVFKSHFKNAFTARVHTKPFCRSFTRSVTVLVLSHPKKYMVTGAPCLPPCFGWVCEEAVSMAESSRSRQNTYLVPDLSPTIGLNHPHRSGFCASTIETVLGYNFESQKQHVQNLMTLYYYFANSPPA